MMFCFVAFPFALHCAVQLCRRLRGAEGDARPLLQRAPAAAAPRGASSAGDVEMAQAPRASAAAAAIDGNALVIDGNVLPFEAARFGPAEGSQAEPVACMPFHAEADELRGKLLAIRRKGKLDFSYVQTIAEAEAAGALGIIVVSHTADVHLPSPSDGSAARARIRIPVMAVGLSAYTATLTRVGAKAATFRFARARDLAGSPRAANSSPRAGNSSAMTATNSDDPRVAAALRSDPVAIAQAASTNRRRLAQDLATHAAGPGSSAWHQPISAPPEAALALVVLPPPPPPPHTIFEVEDAVAVVPGLSMGVTAVGNVAIGEAAPVAVLGGTVLGFTPPVSAEEHDV